MHYIQSPCHYSPVDKNRLLSIPFERKKSKNHNWTAMNAAMFSRVVTGVHPRQKEDCAMRGSEFHGEETTHVVLATKWGHISPPCRHSTTLCHWCGPFFHFEIRQRFAENNRRERVQCTRPEFHELLSTTDAHSLREHQLTVTKFHAFGNKLAGEMSEAPYVGPGSL